MSPLCEDFCDTFYDRNSEFTFFKEGRKEAQADQVGVVCYMYMAKFSSESLTTLLNVLLQSKGTSQSSASSSSAPHDGTGGALGAPPTNTATADWQWLSWMPRPAQGQLDQQPNGSGVSKSPPKQVSPANVHVPCQLRRERMSPMGTFRHCAKCSQR